MSNHFLGFVTDNNDPMKIGRCKVKVIGLHDSLSDSDLPWIQPMIPLNHNIVHPPDVGSQVIVLSLDEHNQTLLMIGIVPGVNDASNSPDTPSLARNDIFDPPAIISKLSKNITNSLGLGNISAGFNGVNFTGVPSLSSYVPPILTGALSLSKAGLLSTALGALGSLGLTEPDFGYATQYPLGKVEQVAGGFILHDSTIGASMMATIMDNGSYTKISADGTSVTKSVGTQTIVNDQDHITITKGSHKTKATDISTVVEGSHDEVSVVRNITASSGGCNLMCWVTGSPYHFFG